ncbi:MAG: serine hydrolase [Flavobacteriales bacterium]|nr:serine hydrolase [Flavobacteriales bacterium]
MRFLKKLLLWLTGIIAVLTALAYATGNGHLPRGMWYTYLRGRSGPEIDDRDFFPSAKIPADAPQPWSVGERFGKLKLSAEQEATLLKNYTVGFVLFQNDSMIHEQYWNGWNSDSVSNSFSVAKSYVSVLTGIAMQEGKIKSVFQPVGDFLPEFAQEECKKKIQIYHVLTMSTGLDWGESGADPFSDNAKGYYGTNVRDLSLNQPCRDTPGVEFDYISGSTQIMAEVLEKVYGQTLDVLVREKIWKPLGCEHPAFWGKDTEGGDFKAFCCLYATARDFGRIGQLYLDSGKWNGRQLVPREYWQASITPAPLKDHDKPNKRYGYFWWLMELDGKPVYYCRGYHGEYVVVVPHEHLVMVRTGMLWEEKNAEGHPQDVMDYIGIARALAR